MNKLFSSSLCLQEQLLGHQCPVTQINALLMPFSMGDYKTHQCRCLASIVDACWDPWLTLCHQCKVC